MASVVIPAHDESAVVGRCLRALLAEADPDEFEVVVVANGCSDDTYAVARDTAARLGATGASVTVIDRSEPGKIGALNAADRTASTFPRIYLDADAVLTTSAARATARLLQDDAPGSPQVAAPAPRVVVEGVSALVRWHYEAWQELPVIRDRYVGSGVYALSARGHARIAPFPDVIADDHYVRRSFAAHERATAPSTFELHPARSVRGHLHRSARARSGNTALDGGATSVRREHLADETTPRGARAVLGLLRHPRMWHRAGAFVLLTALVRLRAHHTGPTVSWNQDSSSRGRRQPPPSPPEVTA